VRDTNTLYEFQSFLYKELDIDGSENKETIPLRSESLIRIRLGFEFFLSGLPLFALLMDFDFLRV
jgi:hypothetical protein